MSERSAEDVIRWYFTKRENVGAPAIDLVASRGWIYADKCGAKLLHGEVCQSEVRHSTKQGFYVCGRCGNLWHFDEAYSLKGEVQTSPRPDHFESKISRVVDVGRTYHHFVEDPRWKWKARIFVASALGWSDRELLDEGPVAFAAAGSAIRWTPWGVRSARSEARREWVRRLRGIGIDAR